VPVEKLPKTSDCCSASSAENLTNESRLWTSSAGRCLVVSKSDDFVLHQLDEGVGMDQVIKPRMVENQRAWSASLDPQDRLYSSFAVSVAEMNETREDSLSVDRIVVYRPRLHFISTHYQSMPRRTRDTGYQEQASKNDHETKRYEEAHFFNSSITPTKNLPISKPPREREVTRNRIIKKGAAPIPPFPRPHSFMQQQMNQQMNQYLSSHLTITLIFISRPMPSHSNPILYPYLRPSIHIASSSCPDNSKSPEPGMFSLLLLQLQLQFLLSLLLQTK
jgi:hypothetical protein